MKDQPKSGAGGKAAPVSHGPAAQSGSEKEANAMVKKCGPKN